MSNDSTQPTREFNDAYEAISDRPITIRKIAWRMWQAGAKSAAPQEVASERKAFKAWMLANKRWISLAEYPSGKFIHTPTELMAEAWSAALAAQPAPEQAAPQGVASSKQLTAAFDLAMKYGAVVFQGDVLHTELCMTPTVLANIVAAAAAAAAALEQAGQAAPAGEVSVVPERYVSEENRGHETQTYGLGYKSGWNDCRERVKEAIAKQPTPAVAQVSDEQCERIYEALDLFGREVSLEEYGLPWLEPEERKTAYGLIRAALSALPTQTTKGGG